MSGSESLNIVVFPFLGQGHMIPMIDIARVLAARGAVVTILTTPLNASRFKPVVSRAIESGLQIPVIELQFPCLEAGLPQGCENYDMLPSIDLGPKFFAAIHMLQPQVEQALQEVKPSPTCLISDMTYPWTTGLALKLNIPRFIFYATCCFSLLCYHILVSDTEIIDRLGSDGKYFVVPGLPGRIRLTKAQMTGSLKPISKEWLEFRKQAREAEIGAHGIVVNTFEELESAYIEEYRKVKGKKVWCIGPVSLCNRQQLDLAERGNRGAVDPTDCLNWVDSWDPNSVVYACLGSLSRLGSSQLKELGLGLESSNLPFIWVVREAPEEFRKWLREGKFEERVRPRGLVIHGWAPQVLILSHPSVGGFLTHCGWNSTLEGISSGLPMITWPVMQEQFVNEKLIVDVLKVGVKAGVELPVMFGDEEKMGVLMNQDDVKVAIQKLMDEGEEGETRRKRAKQLGDMARRAVHEGGSSHLSITRLIHDIISTRTSEKSEINCGEQ